MQNILSSVLVVAFVIESWIEIRCYSFLHRIMTANQVPLKFYQRVQRVVRIDQIWNLASWLLVILMIVAPGNFSFLIICIVTLIETLIVREMSQLRHQLRL